MFLISFFIEHEVIGAALLKFEKADFSTLGSNLGPAAGETILR